MDNVTIDRGDADPPTVIDSAATSRRGTIAKIAGRLIVIALGAAALLQLQHVSKTEVLGRIYMARETLSSQSMMVSSWVGHLPQVIDTRRTTLIDTVISPLTTSIKDAAGRAEAMTAESVDMVWERSQSLLRHLHPTADYSKKGVVAEEQNNVLHRALDGLQGIFHKNKKEAGLMNGGKKDQSQKRDQRQGHRRLKATENEEQQTPSNHNKGGLFLYMSSSPIAAAILIFCGAVFLIVSVAMASGDSRRLRRLADSHENRTIVLDEEEAEIIEFYEKEMESGMMQSFPFLENDDHEDDCRDDDADEEQKRGQSFIRIPASDSSLNRQLSGNSCDSYYSRVLQDITSFDEDEDDQERQEPPLVEEIGEKSQEMGEDGESFARDKAEAEAAEPGACTVDEDLQLRIPTQAQKNEGDGDTDCPSSPPSSESSISSLTSEVYADIESPLPQHQSTQETGSNSSGAMTITSPEPTLNRKRRSVSFSPDVRIREIPKQVNSEMSSSEKYLYLMLFTVAIIITFCSLLPAPHPSLSVPITDLTAGEMIQRADTILKSQWEVEL